MDAPARLRRIALEARFPVACCALAAVATCLVAAIAVMRPHGYEASALVHMSDGEPLAAVARASDHEFVLYPPSSHYDGVYYYAIARDPLARGSEHGLIDLGSYRYGHAGFGWLAWAASAGRERVIPAAMLAVALACAAIAGAAGAVLARDLGVSAWRGLAIALNPGVVYSVSAVTSETAGVAALLLGLVLWRRRRVVAGASVLAAACLIKEPFLLAPFAIAVYELLRWARARPRRVKALVTPLTLLAVGPLLYAAWYLYLWWRFLVPPLEEAQDFTSLPFTGWLDTFERAAALTSADFNAAQIGAVTIPLLAVAALALLAGSVRSLRLDSEVQLIFLALALTAFSLNWWNLLYPKDLVRALTVQVALLPFVFVPAPVRAGALR